MDSKAEKLFINKLKIKPERYFLAGENAVMEGFQYLSSDEYRAKPGAVTNRLKILLKQQNTRSLLKLLKCMVKIMPSMKSNIKKNFTSMKKYLQEVDNSTLPSIPNIQPIAIDDFSDYVWNKYRIITGFTKLPNEYIFKNKAVPFQYALIFIQEMDKNEIERAPEIEAGIEVVKVYNSLGIITNELALWLKKKYGVSCMANHPLGGLVDSVPLAEKAGLGKIGRNGLLITKNFGPRCRISPIFIDRKLFEYTATNEFDWIEDFCKKCGSCIKNCPTEAIYKEPLLTVSYKSESIRDRYSSYDRERCFLSFSGTMGCAVCIKVCPFSMKPENYEKVKKKYAQ